MSAEPCQTAFAAVRTAEWRPSLPGTSQANTSQANTSQAGASVPHGEVFASADEAAGAAVALALALDRPVAARTGLTGDACLSTPPADIPHMSATPADDTHLAARPAEDQRPWLWVQDREALRRGGRPYCPGLPSALRHRLIHVAARTPQDALFALEEGLRCRDLAFVLGEIAGNPRALSFTASRRLSLAVEKHGVPLWLVRLDAARDLGSARQRWQVRAAASPPPQQNPQAPGVPSWYTELFRARAHPPGSWVLRDDGDRLVAERMGARGGEGDASSLDIRSA